MEKTRIRSRLFVVRCATLVWGVVGLLPGSASAIPSYELSHKVAAAINTNGVRWVCVLDSANQSIQCANDSSMAMTACGSAIALPGNLSAWTADSGLYLVPNFPVDANDDNHEEELFLAVEDTLAGYYKLLKIDLTSHTTDCKGDQRANNPFYAEGARRVDAVAGSHPHLGPKLALGLGCGEDVNNCAPALYVFGVVPWTDANGKGALVGVKIAGSGESNTWTWQYSSGSFGIVNHMFDYGAAGLVPSIAAVGSPTVGANAYGHPRVSVRDFNGNGVAAVVSVVIGLIPVNNTVSWNYIVGPDNSAHGTIGGGLAAAAVPRQNRFNLTDEGDSTFWINSAGELFEEKLDCTWNSCDANPANYGIQVAFKWTANASMDAASDSLAASWWIDGNGQPWAIAYERDGNTTARAWQTDMTAGNGLSFNSPMAMISVGNNGFPNLMSGPAFKGSMALISPGNGTDELYSSGTVTAGAAYRVYISVTPQSVNPTTTWSLF